MVSVAIFLGIALYRDVFALIVGADFREGIYILPVVLGANIMSGIWLNLSFWYKREEKTRFALWVTLTGLIFSIAGGVLLIPLAGYYGAAWSRFIAEAVMVVVSLALNRRYFPTPYDFGRIAEYVALGAVLFVASEEIVQRQPAAIKYTANTLLLVTYTVYAVYREKIDLRGMFRAMLKRR
ncbi:MAG: polysaccharide biosynthesis C-terminal domain-containing protein [Alistipes sp.]